MTDILQLRAESKDLIGTVPLDGSKSITNRALILLALAGAQPGELLEHRSTSKDSETLLRLLAQEGGVYDAGDAGTTFRFMTAYLSAQAGTQELSGSARMRERPIGPLVSALRQLGASIEYLEKEGYPPLRIGSPEGLGATGNTIAIDAGVSSQFLSALLMIGPLLPEGLRLQPQGNLVSRPYLEMTLRMMAYFGATYHWEGDTIVVAPGRYTARPFRVEADWSAASYWYSMAALAPGKVDLRLQGLFENSLQGDSVLAEMMRFFGIETTFEADGIRLQRHEQTLKPVFEWDFVECPDIAQTLAVVCAAKGVNGLFTGLETLSIKETDRIAALKNELAKVGVSLSKMPAKFSRRQPDKQFFLIEGQAAWTEPPQFATYGDHRMAMAFAPLAFLGPVAIEDPAVVRKSYPQFWEHLGAYMRPSNSPPPAR